MEISTRLVGMKLTDENQKHIDKKCAAFGKRFSGATLVNLEIRHDQHHRKGAVIGMRASVHMSGGEEKVVHGESLEETFMQALDEVFDALYKQLERLKSHARIRVDKA